MEEFLLHSVDVEASAKCKLNKEKKFLFGRQMTSDFLAK